MADSKSNRFTRYFAPLLDALRAKYPGAMRPAEATAFVRSKVDVDPSDLTRLIVNGKQTIFENDVHWSRFYLSKAGLIISPKRGQWALSPEGYTTHLTPETTWDLYVRIRDAHRPLNTPNPETEPPDAPADDLNDENDAGVSYWFASARNEQISGFLQNAEWIPSPDTSPALIARIKPGDRIALKGSFVQKHHLPFQLDGMNVSGMRIKATGTVLPSNNAGLRIAVAWDKFQQSRDWYFYTYMHPLVKADLAHPAARKLVDFAFTGASQDYPWFLNQPYWMAKYGPPRPPEDLAAPVPEANVDALFEPEETPPYTVRDIIDEGCFLPAEALESILRQWRAKKNLVLQGPPGTGKTWLAKRLGFALIGSDDRQTTRSRLRIVQFHPSLTYEDFVRGWRPSGDGKLALVDGIMLEATKAAASEPGPFVLVIEEINRGNPAQIFGEMLTLLENTKRRPEEAIELAYRTSPQETIHLPDNLYVIGTMNIADRSLAIVDLALRRRFAFVDLHPCFGQPWTDWCAARGLSKSLTSKIQSRIVAVNDEIASAPSLGPQFRIGHSFLTPDNEELIEDGPSWYTRKIETEVGPLLEEYWYDAPEKARKAIEALIEPLV